MPKKKQLEIKVEPSVIRWAIQSSGWKIDEISPKIQVTTENINKWISGDKNPTLRQLEALAKKIKRPLAAFFLPSPPEERHLPEDFRMSSEKTGALSKDVLLAIRRARRFQSVSSELLANLNQSSKPTIGIFNTSDDVKRIASEERELSKISLDTQSEWKSPHKAFRAWREYIESKNIIVLQVKMPPEEVRGLSIIDEEPYVIVVSSGDNPYARIFTLLHEYAHILLKKQGICLPEEFLKNNPKYPEIEKWCDSFAGNFLIPNKEFNTDMNFISSDKLTSRDTLTTLSNRYCVSKGAILTKMRIMDKISKPEYDNKMGSYEKEEIKPVIKKEGKKESKPMKLSLDKQCVRDRGNKFISLVIENVNRQHITNNDALDYLSIKLKHWNKMLKNPTEIKK